MKDIPYIKTKYFAIFINN